MQSNAVSIFKLILNIMTLFDIRYKIMIQILSLNPNILSQKVAINELLFSICICYGCLHTVTITFLFTFLLLDFDICEFLMS